MATRRLSGIATSSSVPDNGGDHSGGGGGSAGGASDDVFSTYLYKGTSADRDIENGIDLAGEGGMVWIKKRTGAENHVLTDTERGATKTLVANDNSAEATDTSHLTGFNSDGFNIANGNEVNHNRQDFVSWTFRKAKNFFDVVKYTGVGTPQAIPHNLGSRAGMIIVKRLEAGWNWQVYHRGKDAVAPENYYLQLDRPNAREVDTGNGRWGGAAPTEQAFTVGNSTATNESGSEYIAYLFAHDDSDESIIKCGSFPGRYSTIDLGFEPQWVLIKPVSGAGPWSMLDTMRGWPAEGSAGANPLRANEDSAEIGVDTSLGYITSTGFYVDNVGGGDFIYMAIRRPTKPASELAATDLFQPSIYTGNGGASNPAIDAPTSPQAIDLSFFKSRQFDRSWEVMTRLLASHYEMENKSNAPKGLHFDLPDGEADVYSFGSTGRDVLVNQDATSNLAVSGESYAAWRFSRAPGFFDVVAWTGDGVDGRSLPHNLGVTPEFAIIKRRRGGTNWLCRHSGLNENQFVWLDENTAAQTATSGGPNGEAFAMDDRELTFNNEWGPYTNFNNEFYIAYLFASVPGISKVGSYTGNGGDQDIDCGFTTGARFVLIKRTDADGDWMFFDTLRGITAGSSPMLKLNYQGAEATGSYIKPIGSGFTVTSNLTGIDGAQFIFYAIA